MSWVDDVLNKAGGGITKDKVKEGMRASVNIFKSLGWDKQDIEIFIVGSMEEKLGKAMAELIAKWLWEIFNEESGVQVQ